MKKLFSAILFLVALYAAFSSGAQVIPSIEWQKSFGGSANDSVYCIQQTIDGGYIITGSSWSNDSDVTGNHGGEDYWIVKLHVSGNMEWQKSLGGSGNDVATSIQQTSDGGFIVAGSSASNDGDVSGNHGLSDFWIVRLEATGNLLWQKSLGGSKNDKAYSVQQTSDGGFIVAGSSYSNDGDVPGNHGYSDDWIVRLDLGGNLVWQKYLGGLKIDLATSVQQTTDGGFIIAGASASTNADVVDHHGSIYHDYWVLKLDGNGDIAWQKCLGSWGSDYASSIRQINGGGFIVAGYANTNNGDVTGNHGGNDYWIVKLDTEGNLVWQKSLGGTNEDRAYSVQQTADGGFIIAGASNSIDGDVSGLHGASGNDEWIVKLNAEGNLVWQKMYGGFGDELAYSVFQTADKGFIIAGSSNSHGGDVSGNHGSYDYWIMKLSSDSTTGIALLPANFISLYPNPVQSELHIELTTHAAETTVRVYDLRGRIMDCGFRIADSGLGHSIRLNTENLADGFYTLQIIHNKTGASEVGKFVKQR